MSDVIDLSEFQNRVFVAGDIHGLPVNLAAKVSKADLRDAAVIILGDVGLGFGGNHKGPIPYLHRTAKDRNVHYYVFRGNHDNPATWTHEIADELEEHYPNVHFIRDMDEIKLSNDKIGLVVPGAISIDRNYAGWDPISGKRKPRKRGTQYWEDEHIRYDLIDSIEKKYDFILAHTGATPPSVRTSTLIDRIVAEYDSELQKDLDKEREAVFKILEKSGSKLWINGHYHVENDIDFQFEENGITFKNLGIEELKTLEV